MAAATADTIKPKYTIEIYDLPEGEDTKIGYRIVSMDENEETLVTDADYLVHSLSETLSHIGRPVNREELE